MPFICALGLSACGATGPQGEQGPQGEIGHQGESGPQGEQGQPGKNGTSFLSGNGAPSSDCGDDGDTYLDLETGDVYLKDNGVWSKARNIGSWSSTVVGEQGPQGETGKSAYELYVEENPDYTGDESQWVEDLASGKLRKITISFDSNGGSRIDSVITSFGSYVSVQAPVLSGYDFVGWKLNGSLIDINTYVFFADCTLVAQWREANMLAVSFDPNGGVVAPGKMMIEYGKAYTLPIPSKEFQAFVSWYYGDVALPISGIWNYTHEDIELTAKWNTSKICINLEVDSEYGSSPSNEVAISIGDKFILPVPTSIKDGYTFTGWYLEDEKITSANGESFEKCRWTTSQTLRASYFIEIGTIYDFMNLGEHNLNGNYLITNDLDFMGLGVNHIGVLNGTIDGGDHTLSNFVLSTGAEYSNASGLVKELRKGSSIQNITLDNVTCVEKYSSGVVGTMYSGSSVKNVTIRNSFNSCQMNSIVAGVAKRWSEDAVNLENINIVNSGANCQSYGIYTLEYSKGTQSGYTGRYEYWCPSIKADGFSVDNENKSPSSSDSSTAGFIYNLPYISNPQGYDKLNRGTISISKFSLNAWAKFGIVGVRDYATTSSSISEVRVSKSTIKSPTTTAWSNVDVLEDSINLGTATSWGSSKTTRCIDVGNEYGGSYTLSATSSIVLFPDANGVYTYMLSSGVTGNFSDSSLITKEMFISMLGFDETIWNLDEFDLASGVYPSIR